MMLMTMQPQKQQYVDPLVIKYTANASFTARNKALMFGFRHYKAFIVGAAGGYSGQAAGATYRGTFTSYASAPGGGGSLMLEGDIASLSANESVVVGAVGGNGLSTGVLGNKAGDGAPGGNSSFHGYSAYGGAGGIGDRWNNGPSGHPDVYNSGGYGGNGGGNSAGLGGGGVRGTNGDYYYTADTGSLSTAVSISPTAGTFVAGGTAPVTGGGKGGGGGTGDNTGVPSDAPRAGAAGSNTFHVAAGGAVAGSVGGSGGGADLFDLTGVHEYYGNNISGKSAGGAVVLVLS